MARSWLNPEGIRRLIHARYARAVVAGVATALIVCSAGITALEIRHGVSFQAVARFFSRPHLKEADLRNWLRSPETLQQLEGLIVGENGFNPGGVVYATSGALRFHPHLTELARSRQTHHRENLEIYPRLLRHYFAADLESLLGVLTSPPIHARLEREGVDPGEIVELHRSSKTAVEAVDRSRLLRRAATHILRFSPFERESYELPLSEKLRFYETNHPEGHFVGAFEVFGFGLGVAVDDAYGHSLSEHNHYLAIVHLGPGRYVIHDFYRGRKRSFSVEARPYPGGILGRRATAIS